MIQNRYCNVSVITIFIYIHHDEEDEATTIEKKIK